MAARIAEHQFHNFADTHNPFDLCLFINRLPIFTFELNNNLTKQTARLRMWYISVCRKILTTVKRGQVASIIAAERV